MLDSGIVGLFLLVNKFVLVWLNKDCNIIFFDFLFIFFLLIKDKYIYVNCFFFWVFFIRCNVLNVNLVINLIR